MDQAISNQSEYMVTATIVTYNNDHELLSKAINSFLNTDLPVRLYIVDNSPEKGVEVLCNDSRIEYIFANGNNGFGAGHNIVIKKKSRLGKYHLVLNPDVYYEAGVVENLVKFMDENEDVGLCMPNVRYPNGQLQYLAKLLPTPLNLLGRFLRLERFNKTSKEIYEMRFSGYDKVMSVPYLSGCFMFIRSEVLSKVGGFDEGFFMYCEDIDLSRRIGMESETSFYPYVNIYHEFQKGSSKSIKLMIIHIKSAIHYFNKWGWFSDDERNRINKAAINQF
ncbi:MAG: glycosyltransferase family 2 protein [Bacteroidota bacterium]|nr:glycosyltransferase family 2 protein [Bacteroidota bacterium]